MFRLERSILLCLLASLPAAGIVRDGNQPEVPICMRVSAEVPQELLAQGESIAAELFEDIGVRLRWTCRETPSTVDVLVSDRTPRDLHRGAFGYALPYAKRGERVVVFYDRFAPLTISNPIVAPAVFGHVLAHEIAHVLAGVASHADTGLMRASWTNQDLMDMRVHRLRFSPEVGNFIYRNLTKMRRNTAGP